MIVKTDEHINKLMNLLDEAGHEMEDWSSNVRYLCKQCSQVTPHEEHDHDLEDSWNPQKYFGVATLNPEKARGLIRNWADAHGYTMEEGHE